MDIELRKQPAADEGAGNSNDEIADEPKPRASRDLTGQPSGNEADRQYDQKALPDMCMFLSPFDKAADESKQGWEP